MEPQPPRWYLHRREAGMEFRILGPLEVRGEGGTAATAPERAAPGAARAAPAARERGRPDRPVDRRALGERADRERADRALRLRLAAAQGPRRWRPAAPAHPRPRLPDRARVGPARCDARRGSGRGRARRPARWRAGAGRDHPARGPLTLAWAAAHGVRLQVVRAGGDPPARGAAPGRARGAD